MPLQQKTDYVEEGLGYLRQGQKNRPKLAALLTVALEKRQELEAALLALQTQTQLKTAVGATLDGIGELVGAERNGLDDEAFRLYLFAQIAANHGDGTLQTVLQLAKALFGSKYVFARSPITSWRDSGASNAFLELSVSSKKLPQRLLPVAQKLLRQNIAAGIAVGEIIEFDDKRAFGFRGAPSGQAEYVGGWGSVYDVDAGAPFAKIMRPI